MSTNKTEHYHLNQWQAADKVLRTEFNEDNAKIDAALAGILQGLAGKADRSELPAVPRFITGSYVGTGTAGTVQHSLGGRPKFLLLTPMKSHNGAYYCGLIAAETFCIPFYSSTGMSGTTGLVTFTDDGFQMVHQSSSLDYAFNRANVEYRYLAVC